MNNASWEGGRESSHSAAGIRPTDHGAVIDVSRPESTLYYAAAVTESRSAWQSIDDSSIWLLEGEKKRHMSLTENATYFFFLTTLLHIVLKCFSMFPVNTP